MLRYPVELTPDDENGGYLIGFPDMPFVHSVGDTLEEALREAEDDIKSGIDRFFDTHQPVPLPSAAQEGQHTVELDAVTVAKVLLHNEMISQGIKKAELARRMDIAPPSVERIFNARHKTRIKTMETAFKSLGRNMQIIIT
ncbi:MAG: type II toxin-antitoxin system HicB family antitoxin [Betaproteobacteria bacterium]|nr:type II toxin-antitoxin system HicB family antitoxin [Betaproteobacteria bacterium]